MSRVHNLSTKPNSLFPLTAHLTVLIERRHFIWVIATSSCFKNSINKTSLLHLGWILQRWIQKRKLREYKNDSQKVKNVIVKINRLEQAQVQFQLNTKIYMLLLTCWRPVQSLCNINHVDNDRLDSIPFAFNLDWKEKPTCYIYTQTFLPTELQNVKPNARLRKL